MTGPLTLADDVAEAIVLPSLGAGLARYDFIGRGRREPLFRPAPDDVSAPFSLASILLVPWSNRISGGGFHFDGQFHPLKPNAPNEPFPIHGNGFSAPWLLSERGRAHAVLSLVSDGPGPFRYQAEATYALNDGALTMSLSAMNRGEAPLPFGLGFHPWLPRGSGLVVEAGASHVWLEDDRHLPTGCVPITGRPEWDFSSARPLPDAWINNVFEGWNGRASFSWSDRGLILGVRASPELSRYVIYSPSCEADFFCFEPVTHPVDAHNLAAPVANGLVVLSPGSELRASCRFAPRPF